MEENRTNLLDILGANIIPTDRDCRICPLSDTLSSDSGIKVYACMSRILGRICREAPRGDYDDKEITGRFNGN